MMLDVLTVLGTWTNAMLWGLIWHRRVYGYVE
jgi:hypothetical protein